MKTTQRRVASQIFCVSLALFGTLLIAGCQGTPFIEGGPEIRYLTSKPPTIKSTPSQPLLPLTPGTKWEMHQIGVAENETSQIEILVARQEENGDKLLEVRKNGKLWRREVYKDTPKGLYLTAMAEDDNQIIHLTPPVPILLYPAAEGNSQAWTGTFQYGNIRYPATSYSRISAVENVVGPTGKNRAYRTDTLVSINQGGNISKFPTLRWLTPGIGFTRRSFVDQGRTIYVELNKFTPKQ
jgi:hypothetical protein